MENIVLDATDAGRVGRFWIAALDLEPLTDEAGLVEARLHDGSMWLDLCVVAVPEPRGPEQRAHLDLRGGGAADQQTVVERLLGLGASHLDIGQGDAPWVVLGDPEGTPFCVMEDRPEYRSGPIAAVPLDSAAPDRDAAFYAALSGWVPAEAAVPAALRHPSGDGPLLELCPEDGPKTAKNRLHLDVRLEAGDDEREVLEMVRDLGGEVRDRDSVDLPWTLVADPSGNEVCLLAATSTG